MSGRIIPEFIRYLFGIAFVNIMLDLTEVCGRRAVQYIEYDLLSEQFPYKDNGERYEREKKKNIAYTYTR